MAKQKLEEQISEKEKERKERGESEDYSKLEERYETIREKISVTDREIGSIRRDIETLESKIKEKRGQIKKLEAKDEKEKLAKRRVEVVDEVIQILEAIYDHRSQEVREQLQKRIQDIYQEISFKPYVPELSEDYHLLLKKEVGEVEGTVAKSTGENQILSLAFIGSLVDYARTVFEDSSRVHDELSGLSFRGGIYPLVIDSPFGQLDEDYRKSIASGIPRLSPQVILMVSKSQGMGIVQEKIASRVGKSYVLTYHTPKEGYQPEELPLNGRTYPYIKKSNNGYEFAEILEIN